MKKKTKSTKEQKKEEKIEAEPEEEEEEPSFVSTDSEESEETLTIEEEEKDEDEEDTDDDEDIFQYSDSEKETKQSETKLHFDGPVKTPEWERSTEDLTDNNSVLFQHFDMVRTHKRLQIIEIRINNRVDKTHIHPAYSPEIENSTPDLNETEREIIELGSYRTKPERKIIPRFWPRRCYDNENDILSEEKSEQLREQIASIHERKTPFNLRDRTKHFSDKDLIKMPNKKLKLVFSLFDYETDHDDEITDWEDDKL